MSDKHSKTLTHGEILGFYAIVYDENLRKKIIIPITRADVLRGRIRLP